MYNAQKPTRDELPSSAQLLRSTILALVAALVILVTIVMPAEYNIDPTGIGRAIGLAEMGEIKTELAREAEQDRLRSEAEDQRSDLIDGLLGLFVSSAQAQETWKDDFSFTLEPGEGIEWKLVMEEGATAEFSWSTDSGRVNFDLHGDGGGQNITYEKGRGTTGETGVLTAAFTGNHGWFWRNRDSSDITVRVQLRGDYSALKQTY